MAIFESYTQLREAEDIQDEIYIISPVDNPFCSMSRTIKATGKFHEWTEDTLNTTGKNAHVEGASAPADESKAVIERDNYCQIMSKVAEISGTLEVVDKYGRDSEMAYQLEMRYGELANDEESAAIGDAGGTGRQTAVAGDAVTAREFACIQEQFHADVIIDATGDTLYSELEAEIVAAHLATYNAGGNPGYALTDPLTAGKFANFALSAGRQRDINNDKMLVNVIDLYVSTYGELDVVLDRNATEAGANNQKILLLDFNYCATPVLRATRDWPLAKIGDSDRRQILRESTVCLLNQRAGAMVDNIPDSLAVA